MTQTCISTLATRHLAVGKAPLTQLNQLRGPMEDIMGALEAQLKELARYKAHFGDLPPDGTSSRRSKRITRSSVPSEARNI